MRRVLSNWVILGLILLATADARGVERFPPPDFETPYEMPGFTQPLPRSAGMETLDVAVLVVALSLAAWLIHRARSRKAMIGLSLFSLAYFGFYRGGCVCPIGAIQHVALSVADGSYVLPFSVALFFALPLVFALMFGRVFCAGVCPLGAVQDVVLIKPVKLPDWAVQALGVLPFAYLGLAVLFAVTGAGFVICRFDPFVSFFRLSGPVHMLVAGGLVVAVSAFIGRPYCRFLCPYGVLLGGLSRAAWAKVSITPDECCVGCSLCEDACPFGAIVRPTPQGVSEEL